MANECLLTKLKGVVDNDNLPKYNTIKFSYSLPSTPIDLTDRYFYFYKGTITCVNGKTFSIVSDEGAEVIQSGLTTYTTNDWVNIALDNSESYVFELTQKYTLGGFGSRVGISPYLTLNADDFSYSPDILEFSVVMPIPCPTVTTVTGKFKVPNDKMNKVFVPATMVELNLDDFANTPTLVSLNCHSNKNVRGLIQSLGKSTSIQSLVIVSSSIEGDIVALANALVANGKTSGTVDIRAWGSNVTIGGVPYKEAVDEGTFYCRVVFDSSVSGGYTISYY